jgi:HSP20 family protein
MARNLVRFDPFAELDELQKQLFTDGIFASPGESSFPTTDVYTEDDKQLTVEAHLPDFAEKDINVSIDQGALIIQAEKHETEKDKRKKYVVRESSSSFYRRITLPQQADDTSISAEFRHGVLKITVPFNELPSPRKIAIDVGAPKAEAVESSPASAS